MPTAAEVVERVLAETSTDRTGPRTGGPAPYPLIPEGDYEGTVISAGYKTFHFGSGKHGVRKAVVSFRITSDPRIQDPRGAVVDMMKPARRGRSSDLHRAWVVATGHPPRRLDELPLHVFLNHRFVIRVATSTTDTQRLPIARVNWYSKVAVILEKIA